ncbi:trypsin-like peptidase domain-containing protein [Pleurocapsa sp. PCC 7319]|uniref:trypsin-like peptidase domain-containing protein n=1 Tax=Pleurocapsa sp. PCC 7319 TaxID=118161 RepID=UPI00034B8A8C|nr:trypsin-like peptidase domain-containing protein [Pleurocapsa sp. PCC 7319]
MNFPQKLATLMVGLSLIVLPLQSTRVMSEALDQNEIRNRAKSITVKIVESNSSSNGSGVIFNRQNNVYSVLTNQHVVGHNGNYQIHTPDGQKHAITNKEEIPGLDLMVVQFKSNNDYQTAPMGDSEEIAPLQQVYVSGFPAIQADLDIVDGRIRSIRQDVLKNPQKQLGYALIYTNQTLPGSSGGAVLDDQGRLVGINGEAERDIRSGRDISRGIPINLFISLSINYPPGEAPEEETPEEEEPEEEISEEEISEEEPPEAEVDPEPEEQIAYVPQVTGNSNYSLAYNLAKHQDEIKSVSITPNGQTVVTGGRDREIKVWNALSGSLEQTIPAHDEEIKSVAISANGNVIVSAGSDRKIKIWNRRTGQLERTLEGHEDVVNSIALSLNGDTIVSGSDDHKIKIWNRRTGQLERTLEGHEDVVNTVAISADGNTIVSGSQDTKVKVWSWRTWELKQTLEGHEEEIRTVAVSPNGNTIVSGGDDHTIRVWDAAGNLKHTLRGHTDNIHGLVVSTDGQTIISGSRDRSIKTWNIATGALEQSLKTDHSDIINSIAASAGEQVVISGNRDRTLAIWYLKQ